MIKANSFKYKCLKCGYSKIIAPKSDVLNPLDLINKCPKCDTKMEKLELNIFDKIFK